MIVIASWLEFEPHFDQVCKLEQHCQEVPTWDQNTWKNLFERLSLRTVLHFEGQALAGLAVVSYVGDEAELLKICVDPEERKKGAGTALVTQAVDLLNANGVEALYLEVREDNAAAILFYQSVGFLQIGERKAYYTNPVCDAVLYRLKIC